MPRFHNSHIVGAVWACMAAPTAMAEFTVADLKPDYADGEVGVATAMRLHGDDQITQKAVYFKANLEDNWAKAAEAKGLKNAKQVLADYRAEIAKLQK